MSDVALLRIMHKDNIRVIKIYLESSYFLCKGHYKILYMHLCKSENIYKGLIFTFPMRRPFIFAVS